MTTLHLVLDYQRVHQTLAKSKCRYVCAGGVDAAAVDCFTMYFEYS